MSERFSSTVRISDINDFIAPSQGCIVSLKPIPTKQQQQQVEKQVKVAAPIKPLDTETETVKISLKDCLACSGCITSAETVMLEKQSLDEFLSSIKSGKAVVVSLSPQSRASLAAHFGISPSQVFRKLTTFLKSLGVKVVFDTSCSRDLSLIEACNEFIARYNQSHPADGEASKTSLPMITSACPGWICYAEKTLGSYILPYISSVKSPQQTMGSTIKQHICQKMGFTPDNIYHVTIMPCYDKKLEAARDDFVFPMEPEGETSYESEYLQIAEVDSVLTSGEILDLLQLKSVDFNSLEESPLDRSLTNVDEEGNLYGVSGGSGGYAQTVFRNAAKRLFGRDIEGPLDFKVIRNVDFQEVNLEVDGKTVLKFALCYGFRNLQNIVRKIKIGKCDYHFLEVMACPSGCLNGGGQIKPKVGQSGKDLIQSLETIYMEETLSQVSACRRKDDMAGSQALLPVEGEFQASGVVASYTQARKQAIRDMFARGFDEHGKKLPAGNYNNYGFSVTVPADFVANVLEPAFITHCLQTGVRLEGYNIPSIPGADSQRDSSSDGSSLENVNNGPVVATEPYRVDYKRKRQAFGVYTDRNDNGGTVPKTTRTELADGLRPPWETFELPAEMNRNWACSNETQALGRLKQEDYLVLPSEFSPPVTAVGKVGSARVMEKFHPLFSAGVYVLNKRVVGNGEDAVKFGLARLEAVMLGWYDKQREVRFEPIPATAFDDMVADAEMIKKHIGVARLVAWIAPLCAEHTFRTQGHQFLSNLNASYSVKYASLFKSCLVPEIDKFLPDGLMFHTAFHWISPRRVWEVLIANKDKDVIPEAIRLRASDAPVGATIISTSRTILDAMKPMELIAALEEHIVADLECIEAIDKEIRADPVKYHKVPSAYGLGPLPEEDLRVFEHAKREAKNLAPVTKAFVDIMLSTSPMAKQKVLNKGSYANPGLYKLVRRHLIEYNKATPTSLSQVFTDIHIKKVLVASPFKNPLIKRLYEEWLDQPGSEKAKKFIHTEYHPMVKSITSQLHNW